MTISRSYLTVITNVTLAIIGSTIAYFTDWIIIIPIIFGFGIPLINVDNPLKQKIRITLVIVLVTVIIFIVTIWVIISFNFDKFLFPGLIVGIAGVLMLGINGLLIDTVKVNLKTIGLTFLLSGLSLPIWIFVTENILPDHLGDIEFIRHFGLMIFWMILATIGISIGIGDKKLI